MGCSGRQRGNARRFRAGLAAGSASLQADALDIPGGAGNYAISLFVVGMALRSRLAVDVASGANLYGHNAC